jgi:hypothetical protein
LTRVSINLRKNLAKKMGCRVKPGNDGSYLGRFVGPIKNAEAAFADRPDNERLAAAHVVGGEHVGHEV